jgi:hypothetical protein
MTISRLVIVGAMVFCSGCDEDVNATATCKNIQAVDSRLGTLNVSNLPLGAMLIANTAKKRVVSPAVMKLKPEDQVPSPTVDHEELGFDSALDISFSADLEAPVKATLESYIKNSSKIVADKVTRVGLQDVEGLINSQPAVKDWFKKNSGKDLVLFMVYSVQHANSLNLDLSGTQHVGAGVNVAKVGDFKLSVTYKCDAVGKMSGDQFNAFFKAIPLMYDNASAEVKFDPTADVDFKQYNFVNALD